MTVGRDGLTYTLIDGTLTISGEGPCTAMTNGRCYISGSSYVNMNTMHTVVINPGVTSIGRYAFRRCSDLTTVSLPDTITSFGSSVFEFTALADFTFPPLVSAIPVRMFSGCWNLHDIFIPESIQTIDNLAFTESGIRSVTGCAKVQSINSEVFSSCANLTSVHFGKSLKSLDPSAFNDCPILETIDIDPDNEFLSVQETTIVNKKLKEMVMLLPNVEVSSTYTIPEGVERIGAHLFENRSELTKIILPDSLRAIGPYAFSSSGLQTIEGGHNVIDIGEYAFNGCESLENIFPKNGPQIFDNLLNIEWGAFTNCSFTELNLPESLLYAYELNGLSNLTYVYVPPQFDTEINWALANSNFVLEDCVVSPDNASFKSIDGVLFDKSGESLLIYPPARPGESYTVPSGVKVICDHAIADTLSLRSLTLNDGLEVIYGLDANTLAEIVFPSSLIHVEGFLSTSTSTFTFGEKMSPSSVNSIILSGRPQNTVMDNYSTYPIPSVEGRTILHNASQATVGDYTIGYNPATGLCSVLSYLGDQSSSEEITVPNQFTIDGVDYTPIHIGPRCFSNLSTEKVNIPSTIIGIGNNAFSSSAITELPDLSHVTLIEDRAFFSCTNLTQAYIPPSVKYLGQYIFANCELTNVTYGGGVKTLIKYLENNNTTINNMVFEDGLEFIGEWNICGVTVGTISFPNTLKQIREGGISWLEGNLQEITLPDHIKILQAEVIEGDPIKEFTTPRSTVVLGNMALASCNQLETITFGPNVRVISTDALDKCQSLKTIIFEGPKPDYFPSNMLMTIRENGDDTPLTIYSPGNWAEKVLDATVVDWIDVTYIDSMPTPSHRVVSDVGIVGKTTTDALRITTVQNALLVTDAVGNVTADSSIDIEELHRLDDIAANIQDQLDAKTNTISIGNQQFTKTVSDHVTSANITSSEAFTAIGFTASPQRTMIGKERPTAYVTYQSNDNNSLGGE